MYEGIATLFGFLQLFVSWLSDLIDLMYEGIATAVELVDGYQRKNDLIDLMYEGIATMFVSSICKLNCRLN